jgi:hypothetical protein
MKLFKHCADAAYLNKLAFKFHDERKTLSQTEKFDLSNFLVEKSKFTTLPPEAKFEDTLFVHVVKDNPSMYFYRCVDIIYVLTMLSEKRFIRQMSEFWFKIEDLLLRQKSDFTMLQIIRLAKLYASMKRGSPIFWGVIENHLMINSTQLK